MKRLIILLICISSICYAKWNVENFGTGQLKEPFDVKVAPLRNDGINRVYISEKSGNISEWTFNNSKWNKQLVRQANSQGPKDKRLPLIEFGDVRGDGKQRLYFSEFNKNGKLYEAEWTGSKWQVNEIAGTFHSLSLFVGDGRNDGKDRVYIGSLDGTQGNGLFEYSYDSVKWTVLKIHSGKMEGEGAIGPVMNNGHNLVVANTDKLDVYGWSSSAKAYKSKVIEGAIVHPDPVCIGKSQNDGKTRIVINGADGKVEYYYRVGKWQKTVIDSTRQRGDVYVAALKADGKERIYATYTARPWGQNKLPKGPVKEFTWDKVKRKYKEEIILDGVTGATAKITAGNGRNDGIIRMYTPDFGRGKIIEVTSDSPMKIKK